MEAAIATAASGSLVRRHPVGAFFVLTYAISVGDLALDGRERDEHRLDGRGGMATTLYALVTWVVALLVAWRLGKATLSTRRREVPGP